MTLPGPDQLKALLSGAHAFRALVVGDAMLDEYVLGTATRLSPEAAVPVVSVTGHQETPGGAGNVARQLASLGVTTTLIAATGNDSAGRHLRSSLGDHGVVCRFQTSDTSQTTRKTRVLAGRDHLVRLDRDPSGPLSNEQEAELIELIRTSQSIDAILVSDYAKGVVTANVLAAVHDLAERTGARVFVDPKHPDLRRYGPAEVIKMNEPEFHSAAQRMLGIDSANVVVDSIRLLAALDAQRLVVTLGERGAVLIDNATVTHVGTTSREVYDVGGAGDVFLVYLAVGLISGLQPEPAVRVANLAASLSVQHPGVTTVSGIDVLNAHATARSRLLDHDALTEQVTAWRARGDRIVLTNGCFDLLHRGHIHLIRQAATFGDRLIVAANDDASVRSLKGPGRPLVSQADRTAMLAALDGVDAVVLFDGDDLIDLIELVQPDVLVKGADYSLDEVVGRHAVERHHGRVELVDTLPDHSTTELLSRIRAG